MNKKRVAIAFVILCILLLVLVVLNLCMGSVFLAPKAVFEAFHAGDPDALNLVIIRDIRLPRILAAVILGGALGLSGYLLQTFFNNPIVGPFVLGISSGAKLAVAIALIGLLSAGIHISQGGMILSAFTGALIAMGFVLLLSLKVKNPSILVVCGIMIGYICSAVTDFVVTFADDSNIVNLHNWSMGSFSGVNLKDVRIMAIVVSVCLVFVFFLSKPIGAYRLGEAYAANMGVHVKALRVALILTSSLLAGCVTAFAGPISFVGIAIPHLVKSLCKTSSPRIMIPACFLGGSVITLFCDGIARTVFAPTELSVSSVTAVFLVPVVIVMMLKKKTKSGVA